MAKATQSKSKAVKSGPSKERQKAIRPGKNRLKKDSPERHRPGRDRRVLRTRDTLGDALVALMQEKNFDDITVQDLLKRAGVGRSTFYVHYRDKDDLFLSDVEEFLEQCCNAIARQESGTKRLLPVKEFFAHVRDVREFYAALVRSGKMNDVQELARGLFARSIEATFVMAGVEIAPAHRSAHAYALAGSFFSLLDWWVDRGMKADPEQMDELFHRMAWSGVTAR